MENKNKKLQFADLTINSTALLCPNPTEWFAKAYISGSYNVADAFRTIPGVKYQTKLGNVDFNNVLKAESCDWSPVAHVLSANTYSVTPIQAQLQICKKDIETSFVSLEMQKGSANWSNVNAFLNHYWDILNMEIQAEIEDMRWNGNTTASAYTGTYLALTDGYFKRITGTTGTLASAASAATTTNAVEIFGDMLLQAPATITAKRMSLRFYAASNLVSAFKIQTAAYNTGNGVTGELPLTFNGIPIIETPGMRNNNAILTRKENLLYLFDGEGDSEELTAIDLTNTTGEKVLRTQAMLKVGFAITNPTEIVARY